jgi:hypothetical protein
MSLPDQTNNATGQTGRLINNVKTAVAFTTVLLLICLVADWLS